MINVFQPSLGEEELAAVRAVFESAGFTDVELREFRVTSNEGVHPFWFGRRPIAAREAHEADLPTSESRSST